MSRVENKKVIGIAESICPIALTSVFATTKSKLVSYGYEEDKIHGDLSYFTEGDYFKLIIWYEQISRNWN